MRMPFALAIYVSAFTGIMTTGSFAEGPITPAENRPEWSTVIQAGLAANQRHNYEEALGLFERSWEIARTAGERGASATDLGATYQRLGHINEAKQWLERARQVWSAEPGQGYNLAMTVSDLADLYRNTGEYAAAERLLREALASHPFDSAFDPESKSVLRNDLADLLREQGRGAEAQRLFKESIGSGAVSSRQRISALIGLADIDRQNGDWEAGIAAWNEALDLCRRERDEAGEAIALRGLGMTWLEAGAAGRAEPLLRRALHFMENNPDTQPEQVAGVLSAMGTLYRAENKLALAEDEWSRALQIDRPILGETHPQVAWLMEMLSDVYSARGEFGLAREYATRASEMMSGSFGEDSLPVATALTNRALVEQRAGELDAASKDYDRASRIAREHPENRSLQAGILQRYAELLKAMHHPREAKALLSQSDTGAKSFQ